MSRSFILFISGAALSLTASAACGAPRIVRAGDDLQAAIDHAAPGEELRLEAGAIFKGNFVLPATNAGTVITIRSDVPDVPGANQRVTPQTAERFAKLVSPNNSPALRTAAGANHWRVAYLEFPSTREGYGDIIAIGDGSPAQSDAAKAAHDIVLDHLYVHGDPLLGQKRGIALNGAAVTITNCHISDIKAAGVDTQAIGGWNGPGPFSIENNYLEATGEGFLLGGSDPAIPNLVPRDLVFRFNYVARPMAWRDPIVQSPANVRGAAAAGGTLPAGTYTYRVVALRPVGQGTVGHSLPSSPVEVKSSGGSVTLTWAAVADATEYRIYGRTAEGATQYWAATNTSFTDNGTAGKQGAPPKDATLWQVKNLFELKNARHAIVDSNVFENNWLNAQPGYAIVLTPRNQDGRCPWCIVEQVEFTNNVVRNTAAAFNISGYDSPHPSEQTRGVRIAGNLIEGVTKKLGGNGWGVLIGDAPRDIVFDHNTFEFDGTTLVYAYGGTKTEPKPILGFQFTHNAATRSEYGINGADASPGAVAIKRYFPDAVIGGDGGREGPGADASKLKAMAESVSKGVVPAK
jgi:hypothetical protein